MERNLCPGDTIVIAGVGYGHQLILASRGVGTAGRVIGIEAQPPKLSVIRRNILANGCPNNIMLVCAALGDGSAIAPLQADTEISGGSLLGAPGRIPYHVCIESLPALLQRLTVERLDVLFLDVVGSELPVLTALAAPYLPRLISVSIHGWSTSFAQYRASLEHLGYSVCTIDGRYPKSIDELPSLQIVGSIGGIPRCLAPHEFTAVGKWE
jgi:FkbM family methyltransferase